MKVSVNGQDLFELSDIQCQVICNEISSDLFDEDMKRRLQWVLMHKYEVCFGNLKAEWDSKLPQLGITSVPTNPDEYAKLVFSQKEYMNRKDRDATTLKL